ncbi:tetratricopeptide repeat protein (macronuclear) [Tetrahymena thermophila SB210]|uniref:Tetratricopeptide repeat protein n=1 Tax=Tetrahymena thermophila (strain SB210) TaxID=312017 RepID=Q22TG8_TETTS|nr:tetratricopeptide repeat protein [Tetrahymena thermophila SB210]EAR88470.1 tetratricopeptide repeat protein [Tetrahymena thermophila SB210]|eukprot:XP_001008715.1 tetratricopeptide repeat protein [Tetrahymena thermophila SB210]
MKKVEVKDLFQSTFNLVGQCQEQVNYECYLNQCKLLIKQFEKLKENDQQQQFLNKSTFNYLNQKQFYDQEFSQKDDKTIHQFLIKYSKEDDLKTLEETITKLEDQNYQLNLNKSYSFSDQILDQYQIRKASDSTQDSEQDQNIRFNQEQDAYQQDLLDGYLAPQSQSSSKESNQNHSIILESINDIIDCFNTIERKNLKQGNKQLEKNSSKNSINSHSNKLKQNCLSDDQRQFNNQEQPQDNISNIIDQFFQDKLKQFYECVNNGNCGDYVNCSYCFYSSLQIADQLIENLKEINCTLQQKLGNGGESIVFRGIYKKENSNNYEEYAIRIQDIDKENNSDQDFNEIEVFNFVKNSTKIINCVFQKVFQIGDLNILVQILDLCETDLQKEIVNGIEFDDLCSKILELLDVIIELKIYRITHSDIKPANILINSEKKCIITDFGISILSTNQSQKSRGHTLYYAAPEQEQKQYIDHSTDIFNLGKTFEVLINKIKYSSDEIIHNNQKECIKKLQNIINSEMLEKDQNKRSESLVLLKKFYDIIKQYSDSAIESYAKNIKQIVKQRRFETTKNIFELQESKLVQLLLALQINLEKKYSQFNLMNSDLLQTIDFIIQEFDLTSQLELKSQFTKFFVFLHSIFICQIFKSIEKGQSYDAIYQYFSCFQSICKSLYDIGICLLSEGHYSQAVNYFQISYEIYGKILPESNRDQVNIANTVNKIGDCYFKLGQFDKCLQYYNQSHEIRTSFSNKESEDIYLSLSSLGQYYNQIGDQQKAQNYLNESLEIQKKLLERETHPETAQSVFHTASCLFQLGKYEQALERYLQCLEMRLQVFFNDHSEVATSLCQIGVCLFRLTKTEEAKKYLIESLEMRQRLFKGDHTDTAQSLMQLGSYFMFLANLQKGYEYHTLSLEMKKRLYGDLNHPDVAESMQYLATCNRALGNLQQSLALDYLSLYKRQSIYRGNHIDKANSLHAVGSGLMFQGKIKMAINYFKMSIKMKESIQSNQNNLSLSINNLGLCYSYQGKYQLALEHSQKALEIQQKQFKAHPTIVLFLLDVARSYFYLGNFKQAINYSNNSLIMLDQLIKFHYKGFLPQWVKPERALILLNLSSYHYADKDIAQGNFYLKEAMKFYEQVFESDQLNPQQIQALKLQKCYSDLKNSGQYNSNNVYLLDKISLILIRLNISNLKQKQK